MLIEAMAFGLPVIASSIEPVSDVVNLNPGSGILIEPFDHDGLAQAIISLLQDRSLRQSMSARARELAARFSWERIAEQTLSLYRNIVDKRRLAGKS